MQLRGVFSRQSRQFRELIRGICEIGGLHFSSPGGQFLSILLTACQNFRMGAGKEQLPEWERLLAAEFLGQLNGILTGIRQLRRTEPLDTEMVAGLRVPTLPEIARIKAWLLATRGTVRDYLDTVVLFERLGEDETAAALRRFDEIYTQSNGASPLAEVSERLAAAKPPDLAEIDLSRYRGLQPPWNDWNHVANRGRHWASVAARVVMEDTP